MENTRNDEGLWLPVAEPTVPLSATSPRPKKGSGLSAAIGKPPAHKAQKSLCEGCVFAKWDRTAKGNLHPSGSGWCQYKVPPRVIPASMYFIGGDGRPSGGYIRRKDVGFSKVITECPTFEALPL